MWRQISLNNPCLKRIPGYFLLSQKKENSQRQIRLLMKKSINSLEGERIAKWVSKNKWKIMSKKLLSGRRLKRNSRLQTRKGQLLVILRAVRTKEKNTNNISRSSLSEKVNWRERSSRNLLILMMMCRMYLLIELDRTCCLNKDVFNNFEN